MEGVYALEGVDMPNTVQEALSREDAEQWQEAIDKELEVLVKNGTWEPAVLPEGKEAI